MTKREYAQEIANALNGEVVEVEKENGIIFTGVRVKIEGSNMWQTCYVDSYYDKQVPVDVAINNFRDSFAEVPQNFDTDLITDWANAKKRLVARLLNKKTRASVFMSAANYGFDDLIIVPYVVLNEVQGAVKVKSEHIDMWGVTEDEVFDVAMDNAKKNVAIMSLMRLSMELMHMPTNGIPEVDVNAPNVITNNTKSYGAISVILAQDKLRDYYHNGYVVLPSSVHEVIVTPYEDDVDGMSQMVKEVNATIDPTDVLSEMAYIFKF